jgi:hypothetical protein
MARLHLVAIVIAVFETLVQASYYLDDTDSSIRILGAIRLDLLSLVLCVGCLSKEFSQ